MFLKFPGRDLGGVLAFLQGFRRDAWLALGALLLSLPAALALAVLLLRLAGLHEREAWGYGANLLLYSAAVAQQVTQRDLAGGGILVLEIMFRDWTMPQISSVPG